MNRKELIQEIDDLYPPDSEFLHIAQLAQMIRVHTTPRSLDNLDWRSLPTDQLKAMLQGCEEVDELLNNKDAHAIRLLLLGDMSNYAHIAWSGWMKYLFSVSKERPDGSVVIPKEYAERWSRQANAGYGDLPPDEQKSDQQEGVKILELYDFAKAFYYMENRSKKKKENDMTGLMPPNEERKQTNRIQGRASERSISVDGKQITPARSQKAWNHSPDGFNWGYGGSGPAQTALAILLEVTNDEQVSIRYHQDFKWSFIASLEGNQDFDFELDVNGWLEDKIAETKRLMSAEG